MNQIQSMQRIHTRLLCWRLTEYGDGYQSPLHFTRWKCRKVVTIASRMRSTDPSVVLLPEIEQKQRITNKRDWFELEILMLRKAKLNMTNNIFIYTKFLVHLRLFWSLHSPPPDSCGGYCFCSRSVKRP